MGNSVKNSTPVGVRPPTRAKRRASIETRARILVAAEQLAGEMPVDAINVEHVSNRVGISRATYYLYFDNILAVYLELAQQVCEEINGLSQGSWSRLATYEEIEQAMRDYVRLFRRRQYSLKVLYSLGRSDARFADLLLQTRGAYRKRIERRLAVGIKEGVYRDMDPVIASDALHSMVEGFCVRELDEGRRRGSLAAAVATLTELWFHAIIVQDASDP